MVDKNTDLFICVSFVPFLHIPNGGKIEPEMLKTIVESPNLLAFGCMYDEANDIFCVIINRAEELRDEVVNWSGGEDNYFRVYFNSSDEISDLIISPDHNLSKKRFITSMGLYHNVDVEEQNILCISKIIQCYWKNELNKSVVDILNKKISGKEKLKISFVDYRDIVSGSRDVTTYIVGEFDITNEQPNLLKDSFIEREVN